MIKNNLRKLQLTELEMLMDIDKLCRKNKIRYFLVGGTLLGAVRHKGFIPWDDDIDIAMPREDYEKFINLCTKKDILGEKYFLHCDETDEKYYNPFIKVKKNNTTFAEKSIEKIDTHKGIFIDIFPYDYVPKQDSPLQKIQSILVKNIQATVYVKCNINDSKEQKRKILYKIFNMFSTTTLKKMSRTISTIFNKNEANKYVVSLTGCFPYYKETLLKEKVFPLKEIEFEGHNFFGLQDNDYYLEKIYGNYMKLPPKNQRMTHNPEFIDFNNGKKWSNTNIKDNK